MLGPCIRRRNREGSRAPRGLALALFWATAVACGSSGTVAPPQAGDWAVSTPEQQGLDGRVLESYVRQAGAGAFGEVHSLLVVRHGSLVTEAYFRGYDEASLHPAYSVTKSVTSALVGIALDQGRLTSVHQGILGSFPEYGEIQHMDPDKASITLEDVLTMRAGFEWDEWTYPYADPRNGASRLAASPDWIRYVLDLPMKDPPGSTFRYNSGCSMLLGGVVRSATGVPAHEFARTSLFGPLGIGTYRWETGPAGVTNTGWGLHLRPRDMARLGLLFLQNGEWNGRRLVSRAWVEASTARHVSLADGRGYGYQWWRLPLASGGSPGPDDIRFAWGWGGQFIFVVPSLDMVVTSTAGDYERSLEGALNFIRPLLREAVLR